MILHRNEFRNEENQQKIKDIQDSSVTCLIKVFKFYKVIIIHLFYFFTSKVKTICKQINQLLTK